LTEKQRVNLIPTFLGGPALTWFIHSEKHGLVFDTVKLFLAELKGHCNLNDDENKNEDAFNDLTQTGTVSAYVNTFEELRLKLADVSESEAYRRFLGGLKQHVRKAVRREAAHSKTKLTLAQAIEFALVEDPSHVNRNPAATPRAATPRRDRDPDAMDLDTVDARGRLLPLSEAQRKYLSEKGGCFACRRLGHMQGSPDCPKNRNPNPDTSRRPTGAGNRNAVTNVEVDEVESENQPDGDYDSDCDGYLEANLGIPKNSGYEEADEVSIAIKKESHDWRVVEPDRDQIGQIRITNDDWQLNPSISQKLFERWGSPKVDLFASSRNKQAHFYYRKKSGLLKGEGCIGEDALKASWAFTEQELVYANPPWELAEKVISKLKRDQVPRCILVLPFRNKTLDQMSIEPPIRLEHTRDLFLPPSIQGTGKPGVGPPRWKETWAFLVSGKPATPPVTIPKAGGMESRFVFRCALDGNQAIALADSGCTAMAVSEDYVQRFNLKTTECEPTNFRFANNACNTTNRQVEITFQRDNYAVPSACYVAPIKHDIILGTPWFESVLIRNLDWRNREISFQEHGNCTTVYHWTAIGKPKARPRIRSSRYSNPQEFLRHTEWAAVINIEKLRELSEEEFFEITSTETNPGDDTDGMYSFFQTDPRADPKVLLSDTILDSLLSPFATVFDTPNSLPPSRPDDHEIRLTDDSKIPPWRPLGTLTQYELQVLKEYITDLLNRGYITHSKSPFGSNILFAKKKDGTLRVVVDYRGLNNITIKDRTPLPNMKEMNDRLRGAKVFTKLDLRDGFNNLLVKPEDQHKTAFRTRYGHFQYRVLPFGLCNAPATFMRMMNRIFGDLYDQCIIAYVDDILIYSPSVDQHKLDLQLVLRRLMDHKLYLKRSKCSFATNRTEFCGTEVDAKGIYLDHSKITPLFRHQNTQECQRRTIIPGYMQLVSGLHPPIRTNGSTTD
jgi:hypothetical protein